MVSYKAIQSSNDHLLVKRAGKDHTCAGIAVERGARPGRLKDVWLFGRSKRCVGKIKTNSYYVANSLMPPYIMAGLYERLYERWLPTCLFCAVEAYFEYFTGPLVAQHLRPMTPEHRNAVTRGLES